MNDKCTDFDLDQLISISKNQHKKVVNKLINHINDIDNYAIQHITAFKLTEYMIIEKDNNNTKDNTNNNNNIHDDKVEEELVHEDITLEEKKNNLKNILKENVMNTYEEEEEFINTINHIESKSLENNNIIAYVNNNLQIILQDNGDKNQRQSQEEQLQQQVNTTSKMNGNLQNCMMTRNLRLIKGLCYTKKNEFMNNNNITTNTVNNNNTITNNYDDLDSLGKSLVRPKNVIPFDTLDDNHIILIYNKSIPGEKKSANIEIKGRDYRKLADEIYLNDTIISFYLKFIHCELVEEEKKQKIYIFNTYFLHKMRKRLRDFDDRLTEFKSVYNDLKKWAKTDLFEKEYIIIPLFEDEHWSLIIVCYPYRLYTDDNQLPIFLFLDSLTYISPIYGQILTKYLLSELQEKRKEQYILAEQKLSRLNIEYILPIQPIVLRQSNSYDCGPYMLEYVEMFLNDETFLLKDMNNIVKLNWFPRTLVEEKRIKMAELISRMKDDDPDYLNDYKEYRKYRILHAKPDDYEIFVEEEFEKFLQDRFSLLSRANHVNSNNNSNNNNNNHSIGNSNINGNNGNTSNNGNDDNNGNTNNNGNSNTTIQNIAKEQLINSIKLEFYYHGNILSTAYDMRS